MKTKITVFTPTFNRGYIIEELYKSLLNQTFKDFEWIVVDDGSTDNTEEVIKEFIDDGKISISYFKQQNGGKHRAINKGIKEAGGELFFIVDSDDYLTNNALEIIILNWETISNKSGYCGISGLRGFKNKDVIGTKAKSYLLDCSILDYRYKYGIRGDKAEVFVTDILKENTFPEFEGENFVPEGIIWNRLGSKYKMRWINEIIYICEYLPDGLTNKVISLRIKNINGTLLFYKSLLEYKIPFIYKVKGAVNYYRFLFQSNLSKKSNLINNFTITNLLGIIGGIFMSIQDKYKVKN